MNKILIFCSVIILVFCSCSKIVVRYIGVYNNKGFYTLEYVKKNFSQKDSVKRTPTKKRILIGEEDFKMLKYFIYTEDRTKYKTDTVASWGTFNIEVNGMLSNTSYHLSDYNISIEYFNKLILFLKSNNKVDLAKEFEWKIAMLSNPPNGVTISK